MANYVFISCNNRFVQVYMNEELCGEAGNTENLAEIFVENNITAKDDIYCSSSVDFCEEEGFEVGQVSEMIAEAIELAAA